jgi:hypothetical protein
VPALIGHDLRREHGAELDKSIRAGADRDRRLGARLQGGQGHFVPNLKEFIFCTRCQSGPRAEFLPFGTALLASSAEFLLSGATPLARSRHFSCAVCSGGDVAEGFYSS